MRSSSAEERVLVALCKTHGPLGVSPLVLSRLLGLSRNTISEIATKLEHKGLCTREKVGMRTYLRPTPAGLVLVSSDHIASASQPSDTQRQACRPEPRVVDVESVEFVPSVLLPDPQSEILMAIGRGIVPVATSRLAEVTRLTNRTVHRHATRLYRKGFLSRVREDRRWLWALTRKGRLHLEGQQSHRNMHLGAASMRQA